MAKKKGICRNVDGCDLAADKVVQEVESSNFVCEECGRPLHPLEEPKKKTKLPLIAGIAAVALIGGLVAFLALRPGKKETKEPVVQEIVEEPADTVIQEVEEPAPEPVVEPEKPKTAPAAKPAAPSGSSRGTKDFGYAVFKGKLKNGLPDDPNGTMTYKQRHLIDSRDPKKREAEPGDYIIGEYSEGKLVQGIWYDSTNTVKGSIIIGK